MTQKKETVLHKSVDILNLFLSGDGELSLDEIAHRTHMNKTTARRLALSLIDCGLMKQPVKRGKYSLGLKLLDYTQALKKELPIVEIAEPYLIELGHRVDETVSLALWDGKNAVVCHSIHPDHPLKVSSYEGTINGLHFSSLGKAILSGINPGELDNFLTGGLRRYTPNTITNINDLKNQLLTVRREGVAIDDEEGFRGVRGVAATLKDCEGRMVGAITILGPSVRLTWEKIREIVPIVKEISARISKALGYDG